MLNLRMNYSAFILSTTTLLTRGRNSVELYISWCNLCSYGSRHEYIRPLLLLFRCRLESTAMIGFRLEYYHFLWLEKTVRATRRQRWCWFTFNGWVICRSRFERWWNWFDLLLHNGQCCTSQPDPGSESHRQSRSRRVTDFLRGQTWVRAVPTQILIHR